MATPSRRQIVAQLRSELRHWESVRGSERSPVLSTGWAELDKLLPENGLRRGCLVEWLAAAPGSGAGTLALAAAREAARDGGPVVVVESSRGEFYPPAAALAGIELSQLIVVRVRSAQDEIWAVDQALRCSAVGSVVCWTERFDQRGRRRWQLSAEAGAGLGLLVCPERVRHEACWAEVRLLVEPLLSERGRRLRVEVLRCRGAAAGRAVELELDHETSALPAVVSPPAPAARRRSGA
jgi:protein ImuA